MPVGLGAKRTLTFSSRVMANRPGRRFSCKTRSVYHRSHIPPEHGTAASRRLLLCLGPSPGPRSERPAGGSVTYDQHDTPYLDAALRYRDAGFTPFHTPGHKSGKGAPDGLRELLGDACLRADVAMAGGVEDTRESTQLIRLAEDYAAEAWGADRTWFLVNGSSSGIHALMLTLCGPGRHGHHPPQRPQVDARRTHLHRRRARVHGTGDRPRLGDPAQRDRRAGATRAGRPPRRQGAGGHLADLQRPRRRSRRHRPAGPRGRRAVRDRPGLGPAPALLQPASRGRHDRRRGRRRREHAQAHQRHHADVGADGARQEQSTWTSS